MVLQTQVAVVELRQDVARFHLISGADAGLRDIAGKGSNGALLNLTFKTRVRGNPESDYEQGEENAGGQQRSACELGGNVRGPDCEGNEAPHIAQHPSMQRPLLQPRACEHGPGRHGAGLEQACEFRDYRSSSRELERECRIGPVSHL